MQYTRIPTLIKANIHYTSHATILQPNGQVDKFVISLDTLLDPFVVGKRIFNALNESKKYIS